MKTAEEFGRAIDDMVWAEELEAIEARDAEWRRLVEEAQARSATHQHNHEDALKAVEEAQADAKSWMERSIAIQKQEEKVEAESAARETTIETLGADVKASASEWDRLTLLLDGMYTERDRLRGELAEARRLLMTAPLNVAADSLFAWMCARTIHLAGERHEHDSPPAEQAQGTGALAETDVHKQLQEASRLLGKHTRQIDALNKLTTHLGQSGALQADVVTLQNKVAALEARCAVCGWPARAIMHGDNTGPLNQHVFAPAPPPPEVAALQYRVAKIEAAVKLIDSEHAEMCPQHLGLVASPPPPAVQFTGTCRVCGELMSDGREVHRECETAGSGHAFASWSKAPTLCGHETGPRDVCGRFCDDPNHAVPPIPEGTR